MNLPRLPFDWSKASRVTITGCGTACYAGMVAKYWFEKLARLPVEVEVASELRYREPPMPNGGVCFVVSHSGETAALRYAKTRKQTIVSVVNMPESAIARESDIVLPTLAGPRSASPRPRPSLPSLQYCWPPPSSPAARGTLSNDGEARLAQAMIELPSRVIDAH